MDINRALRSAATTGKVYLGGDQAKKAIEKGEAKLLVVATNHPEKSTVIELASEKSVPVYEYPGGRTELGPACGKPFPVGLLTVVDPGESDIMGLKKGAA